MTFSILPYCILLNWEPLYVSGLDASSACNQILEESADGSSACNQILEESADSNCTTFEAEKRLEVIAAVEQQELKKLLAPASEEELERVTQLGV